MLALTFPEQSFAEKWKTLEREAEAAAAAVLLAQANGDQDAEQTAREEEKSILDRKLRLLSRHNTIKEFQRLTSKLGLLGRLRIASGQ